MLSILKGDTSCRITKDLTEIYFIEKFTFKKRRESWKTVSSIEIFTKCESYLNWKCSKHNVWNVSTRKNSRSYSNKWRWSNSSSIHFRLKCLYVTSFHFKHIIRLKKILTKSNVYVRLRDSDAVGEIFLYRRHFCSWKEPRVWVGRHLETFNYCRCSRRKIIKMHITQLLIGCLFLKNQSYSV